MCLPVSACVRLCVHVACVCLCMPVCIRACLCLPVSLYVCLCVPVRGCLGGLCHEKLRGFHPRAACAIALGRYGYPQRSRGVCFRSARALKVGWSFGRSLTVGQSARSVPNGRSIRSVGTVGTLTLKNKEVFISGLRVP